MKAKTNRVKANLKQFQATAKSNPTLGVDTTFAQSKPAKVKSLLKRALQFLWKIDGVLTP